MCFSKGIGNIKWHREEMHDTEEMNYLVKFRGWGHFWHEQCQHYADYAASCSSVGVKK